MKIVVLRIKNFLSIADAEIKPGHVTQIVGANNQGKTTILKALEVAFTGSKDGTLVKHGESEAEIIVEFDNDMILRRRIKATGKDDVSLKKDGARFDSPQTLLNGLFDSNAFNPLDLLDPKKRTEAILKAIEIKVDENVIKSAVGECPVPIPPLDYNQHGLKVADQAHKYFYQRRAEANKVAKDKETKFNIEKANAGPIEVQTGLTDKETLVKEIEKQNKIIDEQNMIRAREEGLLNTARRKENELNSHIEEYKTLEAKIKELQGKVDFVKERGAVVRSELEEAKKAVEAGKSDQSVIDSARDAISKAQAGLTALAIEETKSAKIKHLDLLKEEASQAQEFSLKLNTTVDSLGSAFKKQLMSSATLPVAGLTFEDDQFFLDGHSIDNLSTSQAMKLSVAVARKLASTTKIICIDGAESLDAESFAALLQEIKDDGYQYFVTKVGDAFKETDSVVTMNNGVAQ